MTDTLTVTHTDTVTKINTDTLASNFDILTAHQWMYNTFYTGYVDSTNLGTLQYKRGASGNLIDMDAERVTYNPDGTIAEILDNGSPYPGQWKFGNDQETTIIDTNSGGTITVTIVKLNSTTYNWYYQGSNGVVNYGEMIPAQ